MLSIITVCYNDLHALQLTGKSILDQTYKNFEWIVIDGGSNDGTVNYLKSNNSVDSYISEPDKGIYDAMNKGTKLCSGEYLIYLNAGDVFHSKNSLTQICSELCGDVIFCGANFSKKNKLIRYRSPRSISSVWHSVPANHQSTIYKKKILGEKPYSDNYQICGDYQLIATLKTQGVSTKVLNIPLVSFELGGISTFHTKQLAFEAWRIQRDILKLPLALRILSFVRRFAAMQANLFLFKFKKLKK